MESSCIFYRTLLALHHSKNRAQQPWAMRTPERQSYEELGGCAFYYDAAPFIPTCRTPSC